MQSPPVGTVVQFFPHGLRNSTRQPYAAIVTETANDGQCKVSVLEVGGGVKGSHRLIHWIGDPWVTKNMAWLAGSDGRMERGVWDWVPGSQPITSVEHAVEAVDNSDRKEQGREKARQLAAEGMDPADIAKKVRGYGLTRADVDELIGVMV